MQAEHEQIITHGYTRSSDWQELAQRSINTRRKIDLQCPICSAEIHPTDTTDLRCLSCHAPVEIYQHRERTETADTRIIYAEVNGQCRPLLSLNLQCLSCERTLQADETCTNTCYIQTYLILDVQDSELYIKRAANRLDVPRDTPFIDIRTQPDPDTLARETSEKDGRGSDASPRRPSESSDTQGKSRGTMPCGARLSTDTPEQNSVENSVENSVQKEVSHHDDRDRTTSCSVSESSSDGFVTDAVRNPSEDADPPNQPRLHENEVPWRSDELTVPEKIVEFLTYINEDHTATGTDIKAALGGLAPSTFKWAMDTLISDGKAYKVAYNLYRLRTQRIQSEFSLPSANH